MYEFCDHLKCTKCGRSSCLFKLRVNAYEKKKTGNIIYVTTGTCKVCYLENNRIKNDRWYGKKKNRNKVNARSRAIRKGNPHYIEIARISYWKHREARLQQKREKYKSRRKHVRIGNTSKFSHKRRIKYDPIDKDHPHRNFNFKKEHKNEQAK